MISLGVLEVREHTSDRLTKLHLIEALPAYWTAVGALYPRFEALVM